MGKEDEKKAGRKKAEQPPKPPNSIGSVGNPLMKSKTLKRALAVAIFNLTKDKDKAAVLIRRSGICWQKGITEEQLTDPLHQGEWNGTNYANWASKNVEYPKVGDKQAERYNNVMPFAVVLVKGE